MLRCGAGQIFVEGGSKGGVNANFLRLNESNYNVGENFNCRLKFTALKLISTPKRFCLLVILCLQEIELLFDALTVFRDGELEGLRLLWRSLE